MFFADETGFRALQVKSNLHEDGARMSTNAKRSDGETNDGTRGRYCDHYVLLATIRRTGEFQQQLGSIYDIPTTVQLVELYFVGDVSKMKTKHLSPCAGSIGSSHSHYYVNVEKEPEKLMTFLSAMVDEVHHMRSYTREDCMYLSALNANMSREGAIENKNIAAVDALVRHVGILIKFPPLQGQTVDFVMQKGSDERNVSMKTGSFNNWNTSTKGHSGWRFAKGKSLQSHLCDYVMVAHYEEPYSTLPAPLRYSIFTADDVYVNNKNSEFDWSCDRSFTASDLADRVLELF